MPKELLVLDSFEKIILLQITASMVKTHGVITAIWDGRMPDSV
jgi:hypothetical protein